MAHFINLLANETIAARFEGGIIHWATAGIFLLGLGSLLSGYAALITVHRKGRNESSGTSTDSESGNGSGQRVFRLKSSKSKQ